MAFYWKVLEKGGGGGKASKSETCPAARLQRRAPLAELETSGATSSCREMLLGQGSPTPL